jgi:hypothetical protein
MFDDDLPIAGSYTDSGKLRFPVEDTPINRVQAALFGQYANKNAREYFDRGEAPLTENQIQEYKYLDLPISEYWDYRSGLNKLNQQSTDESVPDEQDDFPINTAGVDNEWYEDNAGKLAISKVISDDLLEYRKLTKEMNRFKADKKANGDTISGSKKQKVVNYINSLPPDYGQKMLLYTAQYPNDDTYKEELINYLDARDDISYSEMVAILKELGYEVYADGTVKW